MGKKRYYFNKKRVSKGEFTILEFLTQYKIPYEAEKTFPNCLSPKNNKLRFDFYIPEKNLLIEFDGEHHYKPVNKYRRAAITHKRTVIHDKIKNDYVHNNNIELLRIPYKSFKYITFLLAIYLMDFDE